MSTNGGPPVRLTFPAKPEYISLCRLALTGLGRVRELGEETLADLKLALTEACSNSVRHAYGGSGGVVEVTYELKADRLVIEVTDDGEGFSVEERELAGTDGELSEGGLGLAIIRAIADEFEHGASREGRGSKLRFSKLLSG